eukprot:gene1763-33177_t
MTRLGFEASYSINVITRLLTLPMRPYLPSFYVIGFPKCGTTSLAEHLKRHPALSSIVGLPYHETLNKESHYFTGVLGRHNAHSARLYRSFFPTWMCFDACPVYACLPFVAARIAKVTPEAKIIVMVRDPTAGMFSAEVMLRELGVPLEWTLEDEISEEDALYWNRLKQLSPEEPLPSDMPEHFYFKCSSVLHSGHYAELLEPYLAHFKPDQIMVVNFSDFVRDTETTVKEVLEFVGANPARMPYKQLPPSMKSNYNGRCIHPTVKAALKAYFYPHNLRLGSMFGRDFGWDDLEAAACRTPSCPGSASASSGAMSEAHNQHL